MFTHSPVNDEWTSETEGKVNGLHLVNVSLVQFQMSINHESGFLAR